MRKLSRGGHDIAERSHRDGDGDVAWDRNRVQRPERVHEHQQLGHARPGHADRLLTTAEQRSSTSSLSSGDMQSSASEHRPSEVKTWLRGLTVGESPRWHRDRLWFVNWGAQEIRTLDLHGASEVAA